MPLYNFDPGEEGEEDWETELLDENFDNRQKRVSEVCNLVSVNFCLLKLLNNDKYIFF